MSRKADKILVIKLGALGDFIQALGPMAAIRKHHPGAHITLLTTQIFESFAKKSGYFNDVWIDARPKITNIKKWMDLKKALNRGNFSRVYDLQNNDRSCLYFSMLNPKPEWVGIAKGASHRNTSPKRTAGHAFDGHVQTLELAGIKDVKVDALNWIEADIDSFAVKKPYVLLVPGSAPEHPRKRWPAEHYAALAVMLAEAGFQPVVLGAAAEEGAAEIISKQCPEALDLTGKTSLEQIVVLAKDAAGAIGNDTGPMHMIAPTGCPVLVLFSEHSNPVRHAPKGENVSFIYTDNLKDLQPTDVFADWRNAKEQKKTAKI